MLLVCGETILKKPFRNRQLVSIGASVSRHNVQYYVRVDYVQQQQ